MSDHRFDDGVTMGRLTNPPHTDNTLRVYSTGKSKITIQLRNESWYLCRNMDRKETLELIAALASKLAEVDE